MRGARPRGVILLATALLCISSVPINVQAAGFGFDIRVSSMTAVIYEGQDVIFTVSIWNNESEDENNVKLRVYKNDLSGEQIGPLDIVDFAVGETTRTYFWPNIGWGDDDGVRTVYVAIESADGEKEQQELGLFELVAAPNLVAENVVLNASSTLLGGEALAFNVTYSNTGHAAANGAQGRIDILSDSGADLGLQSTTFDIGDIQANTSSTTLEVPAGQLNLNAPEGGTYSARFTILHQAGNGEAPQMIESDDEVSTPLIVSLPAEHVISLERTEFQAATAIEGPWYINGSVTRYHDPSQETIVAIELYCLDLQVRLGVKNVTIGAGQDASSPFSFEIEYNDLVEAGASSTQNLDIYVEIQTENERADAVLVFVSEPNVKVSAELLRTSDTTAQTGEILTIRPGESVIWRVTLVNDGTQDVSGVGSVTWDYALGETSQLNARTITAGGDVTILFEFTAGETEVQGSELNFVWTPDENEWDRITTDNTVQRFLNIATPNSVEFLSSTLIISPKPTDGELIPGTRYTISIQARFTKPGSYNVGCLPDGQDLIQTSFAEVTSNDLIGTMKCEFTIPSSRSGEIFSVAFSSDQESNQEMIGYSSYERIVQKEDLNQQMADEQSDRRSVAIILLVLVAILALVALVFAIRLTDDQTEEEVERSIYAYCPHCDGPIEGDENQCPHCDADLTKATTSFRSCSACDETIPAVMETCPYCGVEQSLTSHYERRERKLVEEIAIPDAIAPTMDTDEEEQDYVVGEDDFEAIAGEFGSGEDAAASQWESELETAERTFSELEAAYLAEVAVDDMDDEEIITPLLDRTSKGLELDDVIGASDQRRALKDDGSELSASDAMIRKDIYDITGEDGVLPGEEVNIRGMMTDPSIVGNEVPDAEGLVDFSGLEAGHSSSPPAQEQPKKAVRRKAARRRSPQNGGTGQESGVKKDNQPIDEENTPSE